MSRASARRCWPGCRCRAWPGSSTTAGLARFTAQSHTDLASLSADLTETRARGYAIDDQERAEGMRCVAAPIFNAYGEPVAGLSISGPAFRIDLADTARLGALVKASADEVTEATGGRLPDTKG
jgi:IclR family acetate operon transcriptional repressor